MEDEEKHESKIWHKYMAMLLYNKASGNVISNRSPTLSQVHSTTFLFPLLLLLKSWLPVAG